MESIREVVSMHTGKQVGECENGKKIAFLASQADLLSVLSLTGLNSGARRMGHIKRASAHAMCRHLKSSTDCGGD